MCLQPLPFPHCSLPPPKHHPSTRLGSIPQPTNLWWVTLGSQVYTATRRRRAVPLKMRPGSRISSKDIHGLSKEPDRAMRRGRGTHRGKSVTSELTTTPVTSLRGYRWSRPRTLTPVHLSACPTCQRSSGGNIPVKRALCAMKFLQTTIGIGSMQYDWDEDIAICKPCIDKT